MTAASDHRSRGIAGTMGSFPDGDKGKTSTGPPEDDVVVCAWLITRSSAPLRHGNRRVHPADRPLTREAYSISRHESGSAKSRYLPAAARTRAQPSAAGLPLPRGIHPPDKISGRGIQRVADPEQRVDRRRLEVPLELADVATRQIGAERELFLRQSSPLASIEAAPYPFKACRTAMTTFPMP